VLTTLIIALALGGAFLIVHVWLPRHRQ